MSKAIGAQNLQAEARILDNSNFSQNTEIAQAIAQANAESIASSMIELGRLYSERCDFKKAEEHFKKAEAMYFQTKEFSGYLEVVNKLLRIYAEMENYDAIDSYKEKLQNLVLKEKVRLDARTYHTLGLCAAYKKQHKVALEYLEKSLGQALASDDKENICNAVHGIALVYFQLDRFEDALKEINNLEVFFQVLTLSELKLRSQMLNGHILRKMGKYEQALEVFWKCYEELRTHKNLYLHLNLLLSFGNTYYDMGSKELSRMYLLLAKKSADPENMPYLLRQVDKQLAELGAAKSDDYDLVFDTSAKSVKERSKGLVDFGNQFILLDLLRLFMREPGEIYSKEAIVEKIWRQSYDPSVHDNKLYVTIKRLRKMIEPDFGRPKYIFRAKNGYFLNKNVKVLVQK